MGRVGLPAHKSLWESIWKVMEMRWLNSSGTTISSRGNLGFKGSMVPGAEKKSARLMSPWCVMIGDLPPIRFQCWSGSNRWAWGFGPGAFKLICRCGSAFAHWAADEEASLECSTWWSNFWRLRLEPGGDKDASLSLSCNTAELVWELGYNSND